MKHYHFLTASLLLLCSLHAAAQSSNPDNVRDTLPAAVKVADRSQPQRADGYQLSPVKALRIVSPLGDGDVIKYIQTLPGVATGGEGGSAIYVRGGNMGSNLMTLDGVPIYGISHLLGLTTVYPPDVIGSMAFHAGGFSSEEGNFTASHIRLNSADGDFTRTRTQLSLSPFLAGASVSAPIVKDKLSLIASLRLSPVGLEYKMARGIIDRYQNALQDFGAFVGDAFVKTTWRPDERNDLSLSLFASMDRYRLAMGEGSDDALGWSNAIANLQWDRRRLSWADRLHLSLNWNDHQGFQQQETVLDQRFNSFQLRNILDELSLLATASKTSGDWDFQYGVKARGARFNPGSARHLDGNDRNDAITTSLGDSFSRTLLATLHGQAEYKIPDRFLLRLALRANGYFSRSDVAALNQCSLFRPEADLTLRIHFFRELGLELTGDYLSQFYHTLEGIPLGWSLDMIVPSSDRFLPEEAIQGYAGLFWGHGQHALRAGGFYKIMDNLVYYGDAASFFNSVQTGWYENISVGQGNAYGAEFLYEKEGDVLAWRLSYTWSKTDRFFPDLNRGRRFPAKYDRRHIANASLDWTFLQQAGRRCGLNLLFTYQSGSWDTLQDGSLPGYPSIGMNDPNSVPMISAINNYELPPFIRTDVSFHLEKTAGRTRYDLGVGVYNLLNRHNPFMLRFNADENQWNYVSLFPILPVLSLRISFGNE